MPNNAPSWGRGAGGQGQRTIVPNQGQQSQRNAPPGSAPRQSAGSGPPRRSTSGHTFTYGGRAYARFSAAGYHYPQGYAYHRYLIGNRFPRAYWISGYYITDYGDYGLGPPPDDYQWIRYGPDVVLVDMDTGEITQVVYGVFDEDGGPPPDDQGPVSAAISNFVGTWNSTEQQQIKSVSIEPQGDQFVIHVWVGCGRQNTCDWGETEIQPFSTGTSPTPDATAFVAKLSLSSANVMFIGHLTPEGGLNVMTFLMQSDQRQRDWWSDNNFSK
jgi:Ni/Co efflux regulator RcnB